MSRSADALAGVAASSVAPPPPGTGLKAVDGAPSFADDHPAGLAAFQSGEAVFVWGRDKHSGFLWRLGEDAALANRGHVKDHVLCPVPGCDAKLTTVHRSKQRDGMKHLSSAGGHSRESVFHSGKQLKFDSDGFLKWNPRTMPCSSLAVRCSS